MSLPYAVVTHTGMLRENNEDHAVCVDELGLYVIADGMGGHAAGEVAAEVAVDRLISVYSNQPTARRIRDEAPALERGVHEANQAVLREAQARQLLGMGTTLTALKFRGRTAVIAHVGDTRVYLLHRRRLHQLTDDHTLVGMLVRSRAISESEAFTHPERNILTQAIGSDVAIEPQLLQRRVPRDARLLLSSDGLHDVVRRRDIRELASGDDLHEAATALVARANQLGGPDNITVILIQT